MASDQAFGNDHSGAALERAMRKSIWRHPSEVAIVGFLWVCGIISLVTTVLIIFTLIGETKRFFDEVPVQDFLFGTHWQISEPLSFGVWELVAGTIAGVPTVVYAFFALTFITDDFLRPVLGTERVPIFNSLSASLVMAVMILPTIASVSEDAMANVPRELREAAYGLGSTRLEVATKVVFPAALSGIIAAILLAIARVIGETMIVAVAAGSTPNLTLMPLESIQTMTGFMLQVALGDVARGDIQYTSLFAVGSALFVFTFITNVAATMIVNRFREAYD
jgi:phosphate transport system permease protein